VVFDETNEKAQQPESEDNGVDGDGFAVPYLLYFVITGL
jgi:hypothetical protein